MKSNLILVLCIAFISILDINAQPLGIKRVKGIDNEIHFRPASGVVDHTYIPRKKSKNNKNSDVVFNVNYNGPISAQAKSAFEDGVLSIINDLFDTPVPINIDLTWTVYQEGALAGASPTAFYSNLPNIPYPNRVYPVALAEKIFGFPINSPDAADIEVNINSDANWYFDYTNPGGIGNRYDFVSVLLHEVIHGMGFLSNTFVDDDGLGYVRIFDEDRYYIFNEFLTHFNNQPITEVEDFSLEIGAVLKGDDVFFKLPSSLESAKIYAPAEWEPGSSMSHLDQSFYNNTSSSLMTPRANIGKIELDPGIATEMLYDMGWDMTYMYHVPEAGSEVLSDPFTVEVAVISDSDYDESSLMMVYSVDTFKTQTSVPLVLNATTGLHEAVLPAPNKVLTYSYYLTVKNSRNITFTNPGTAPEFFFQYEYNFDNIRPVINHRSQRTINNVDPSVTIEATITDEFIGVAEAYVDWKYNGVDQERVDFIQLLDFSDRPTDNYEATLVFPNGAPGVDDIVEYKLTVVDGSLAKNTRIQPANGGYLTLTVVPVAEAVSSYVNDFSLAKEDFMGNGFSITTPAGFANDAIHSTHPYPEPTQGGTGFLNLIYELSIPIKIGEENPTIVFDEIAIIEPGEPGVPFGQDEFWDYVIVEGKKAGSQAWLPFLNGYDARAKSSWLAAYNSQSAGTPSLFSKRTINMLDNGNFAVGDQVFIRFRLFSDPAVNGWGWAIDNLVIQDQNTAVEDFVLEENFAIIPNPAFDKVTVALDLEDTSDATQITLMDVYGRTIMTRKVSGKSKKVREILDISALSSGIYLVNVSFNNKDIISQKLVKQ